MPAVPVTVRVHRLAEPSLLAWARSLAADPAAALTLADLYYASIEGELVRTNGRPERAVRVPGIEPATWLWDFQAGRYWIVYAVRSQTRRGWLSRLLRSPKPEAVILGFQDRAPTPADLARLTTGRNRPV
jgi:hypothetical protein